MASPKFNDQHSLTENNPTKSRFSTESKDNFPCIKSAVNANAACVDNSLGPSGDAPLNHTKEDGAFRSNTTEKVKDKPGTPNGNNKEFAGDKTEASGLSTGLETDKGTVADKNTLADKDTLADKSTVVDEGTVTDKDTLADKGTVADKGKVANEGTVAFSPDNVGGKQEFLVDDGVDGTGQRVWKNCDFCKQRAKTLCRSCSFLYCPGCFDRLHPLIGPFAMHNIVMKSGFHDNETSVCTQHGLAMKLHCTVCEVMRCLECATTVCALHFKSVFSREEISKEKETIMTTLENTQRGVTMLANRVELEMERLETSTLMRRERIIQDFASFHDLLYEKEAEILQALEKERAQKEADVLDKLREVIAKLEIDEAELSSNITAFVQDDDYENFSQKLSSAQNKFATFQQSQKRFYATWARCERSKTATPLLDSHFSLYTEKEGLYTSLNHLLEGNGAMVTFKRKTLSMDPGDVISVGPLVEVSGLPPSTSVWFKFELLNQQKVVWQKETNNLEAVSVEDIDTVQSRHRNPKRLVLRMTPKLIYQTGAMSCLQETLKPCHLLILQNIKKITKPKRLRLSPKKTYQKVQ